MRKKRALSPDPLNNLGVMEGIDNEYSSEMKVEASDVDNDDETAYMYEEME